MHTLTLRSFDKTRRQGRKVRLNFKKLAAMAGAMLFGEREAQILAAREIGNLNSKQKRILAENGGISPLIFMLHSQDYESIEASLFALLNLAFGSERNKLHIANSGAIPVILKILQWQNESSLLELSLAALLILSSCSANRPEIASSGAVQLLFELLDSQFPICESISNQAKLDIISTLQNLSICPQLVPSMIISGGLISLIQLIYASEKSSDLTEKAMGLLESIVSFSDIALNQASETGFVIGMLVEAVEEGSGACKEHAAGILVLICKSSRERYRGLILREGAMPGLLQLSVDGTWEGREKAKALLLLLRDCSNGGSQSKLRLSKKNLLLEKVMKKIDRGGRAGSSIQIVEEMIAKLRT